MKKFLSIILCVLMIVPCFAFSAFAEETTEEELSNVALNSSLKATSSWNASTPAKATINGRIEGDFGGGHENFWSPDSPSHNGDSTIDTKLQSVQYTFKGLNKGYKIIDSIDLYVYNWSSCSANDVRYTVKALINGVWTEVGSAKCSEFSYYECTVGDKPSTDYTKVHFDIPEEVTVDGDVCKVNTTTILVECTEFGVYGCGHGWDVPKIYETVIMGKTGFIPEIDLKAGALLSTNAALSGHRSASSSASLLYPYLAADNVLTTNWNSKATTNGEWIMADFDMPYDLDSLKLNFSGAPADTTYTIKVEVLSDGEWATVADALDVTASTGSCEDEVIDLGANNLAVEAVKVTFTETNGKAASIAEITATIANNKKCQFLFDYLTVARREASANGNIAVYGEPYASTTMDHIGISEVSYLNDGGVYMTDYAWYAKSFAMGQYCGVVLEEESKVNKVILYFNDGIVGGHDARDYFVFGFDVQAKIDGEYKTVASGTNYNASATNDNDRYIVALEFDEVTTDDIRIYFTDTDIGFAYLKELEVFGSTRYDDFSTHLNTRKKISKTTNFGAPYIIGRSTYMDLISPVQTMKTVNDFKALLWI